MFGVVFPAMFRNVLIAFRISGLHFALFVVGLLPMTPELRDMQKQNDVRVGSSVTCDAEGHENHRR